VGVEKHTEKVKFLPGTKVNRINAEKQMVFFKNGAVQFGKLLIATGGTPKELEFMKSMDAELKEKVTTFRKAKLFTDKD
jgi:programmed cell death 8 (apoptosis-inducing factor)